jgi:Calcineurin-like phosphoesterase
MRELTAQELANQLKIVAQITEKLLLHPLTDLSDVRADISRLGSYLQASETKLIRLMNNEHPSDTEPGSTQYGLALYILDKTHPVLRRLLNFPETQITDAMLSQWKTEIEGAGAIDYDGSMITRSKFGNLDAGWVTSLIYYIALKLDVREVSSWAQFGTTPATISVTSGTVKIALIGDWGTGDWTDGAVVCPALEVIDQVKSLAPDYTIHLGDVYYAGTAGFLDSDEEVNNFVNDWVSGSQGSFMLNSNHEMYSGAQGYFGKGLKAAPFALQQNTSYFALQSDKWIIIALDTAYYDKSSLFMNGALSDDNQINFIKSLNTTGKKVIAITHHNPTNVEGSSTAQLPLWNQLVSALRRPPDFWYWGHVHNGIVYSDQSFPAQNGVKARCAGHGAIPFGVAYGLQNADGTNKPSVEYFAHELLSSAYENTDVQQANRVLCGFAMLTLGPDYIKEDFIDQTGAVRWSLTTAL